MQLLWRRDAGILTAGGQTYQLTSVVRNELNGSRPLGDPRQVIRSTLRDRAVGPPIMPRPFPRGTCRIIGVEMVAEEKSDFYPLKILTDATQILPIWELDAAGGYLRATPRQVIDYGYWLHAIPWSRTTHGCGKIGGNDRTAYGDALRLAGALWDWTPKGLTLEVV